MRVKSCISSESWLKRVEQARSDEVVVRAILEQTARGGSLNAAIAKVLPKSRRNWARRRIPAYREQGFEALISVRVPREPKISLACRQAVQAACAANPRLPLALAAWVRRKYKNRFRLLSADRGSAEKCGSPSTNASLRQQRLLLSFISHSN
jgi:hypothetical protein